MQASFARKPSTGRAVDAATCFSESSGSSRRRFVVVHAERTLLPEPPVLTRLPRGAPATAASRVRHLSQGALAAPWVQPGAASPRAHVAHHTTGSAALAGTGRPPSKSPMCSLGAESLRGRASPFRGSASLRLAGTLACEIRP